MKKRILAVLMVALCLAVAFCFTSCFGKDKECTEHTYGEWTTVTVESCTEAGLEKRVCSNCSAEETQPIPASHNWQNWETTTPATCTTDGEKTRACRECDATETETIKSEGHVKQITTEAKDPTATEAGSTEGAKCANCDYVYSEAIELSKLGNLVSVENIKVTEGEDWWGFSDSKYYIADGDNATATRSPKGATYELTITLKDDAFVKDVIVVCNGKGKIYDKWGTSDVTEVQYNIKKVAITCYKDGEVVDVQNFDDTTELTEVKLEGVESYVDTIEVYVESAIKNEGTAVIWEINAYGTVPVTECDKNGHKFSEWAPEKEVTCYEDGVSKRTCERCGKEETREEKSAGHVWTEWGFDLTGAPFTKKGTCEEAGYIGRMCTLCGEAQTEPTAKEDHDWGEWSVSGDCVNGATRTRACKVCEESQTEKSEPGEHANIVYEGYKAPTKEEDGSTGVKICKSCNTTLEAAKILRIVNIALEGKVTTDSYFWASNEANIQKLIDGNRETGVCSSTKVTTISDVITFNEAANVFEIILVVNGKGNTTEGEKYSEVTNNEYTISFALYDENGETIFTSEAYNTLDKVEITVDIELPEGKTAKSMKITRFKQAYISTNYLWEVEVFAEKTFSACDIDGHSWGEWVGTEPVCSQEGLTDGVKTRECTACGTTETQTTPASHSWSDWDMTEINCETGGTKTRECDSCHLVETETVPAGEHANLELQGAKEPTFEEDGYTGDYVCTVCTQVATKGKVISKFENVASNATVTTDSVCWVVKDNLGKMTDGNKELGTGTSHDSNDGGVYDIVFTYSENIAMKKVIITVNGKGSTAAGTWETVTNNNFRIDVTMKDSAGETIHTQTYQTGDVIEIVIEPTGPVSEITLTVHSSYNNQLAIWEVEVISGGEIQE